MTIKGYLTVADVAQEFGVHPNTVRKWCDNGWIKFTWHTVGSRKQRVFTSAQVEAFKRKANRPFSPIRSQREYEPVRIESTAELVKALHTAINDPRPKRAARNFHKALLGRDDKSGKG